MVTWEYSRIERGSSRTIFLLIKISLWGIYYNSVANDGKGWILHQARKYHLLGKHPLMHLISIEWKIDYDWYWKCHSHWRTRLKSIFFSRQFVNLRRINNFRSYENLNKKVRKYFSLLSFISISISYPSSFVNKRSRFYRSRYSHYDNVAALS